MQNFIIKSHKQFTAYGAPHFFVLNKGINCGRPTLEDKHANAFVLLFADSDSKQFVFYVTQALYLLKRFQIHIHGSVIPTIRIGDVASVIRDGLANSIAGKNDFLKAVTVASKIDSLVNIEKDKIQKLLEYKCSLYSFYFSK